MDITKLVVSARNQALLYGDYSTYHRQLAQKLHNLRKKLNLSTKNRGKFTKKSPITAEQIAENHGYETKPRHLECANRKTPALPTSLF